MSQSVSGEEFDVARLTSTHGLWGWLDPTSPEQHDGLPKYQFHRKEISTVLSSADALQAPEGRVSRSLSLSKRLSVGHLSMRIGRIRRY